MRLLPYTHFIRLLYSLQEETRMRNSRIRSLATVVLPLVLLLALSGVAAAASSTTVLGYVIDYLGFVDNGNQTSTWTYAVTADGDEPNQALSHWTLGLDACFRDIVAPNPGSYMTVTSGFGCGSTYNCQASTCQVVHGVDPTTGVTGIKFENCTPQLSPSGTLPRTHIFQITLNGVPSDPGNVDIGLKPGNQIGNGEITGPSCSPNAVSMQSFAASATAAAVNPLAVALSVVVVGLAGLVLAWRSARG
jgi:hypothetical protein